MDKTTKEYHLRLQTGESHVYNVQGLLGSGSAGDVYLVKDNSGKYFALKICNASATDRMLLENRQRIFTENSQELMSDDISGFIPVSQIGTCEENKQPAMLMEYGGKDLEWTLKMISSEEINDPKLKKAFEYKVLLNVTEALLDAHHKGKYHQDILPRNILCGICPEKSPVEQKEQIDEKVRYRWMEDAIINGAVKLTDRRALEIDNDMGSIYTNPSLVGGSDLMNATYFKLLRTSTPAEKDIYACLALYSLLEDPTRTLTVWDFSLFNDLLEINREERKSKLPSLEKIKDKLVSEITTEGYYKIELVNLPEGQHTIITRPIDRFVRTWSSDYLLDYGNLESFFSSHDNSYQKLVNLPAGIISDEEKERIQSNYESLILSSVLKLNQIVKSKHEKRKPIEDSIDSNREEIESLGKLIEEKRVTFVELDTEMVSLLDQMGKNRSDMRITGEYMEKQRDYGGIKTTIENLSRKKSELEQKTSSEKGRLSTDEFNFESQVKALGYIASECFRCISSTDNQEKTKEMLGVNGIEVRNE